MLATLASTSAGCQVPSPGLETFQPPPDARWSAITNGDLRAAYRFIAENHPGAALEANDPGFRRQLAQSYHTARGRVANVRSFEGYAATLAGFANGLRDKHLWIRPNPSYS